MCAKPNTCPGSEPHKYIIPWILRSYDRAS